MGYDAAYQGAPGAFSEEAALRALAGAAPRLLPCTTFEEVFDAVCDGRAVRGVVGIPRRPSANEGDGSGLFLGYRRNGLTRSISLGSAEP